MSAKYYYFKPSGKWKYEGEGESIPKDLEAVAPLTHDAIRELNRGEMPGIRGDGKYYTIVIIDEESWPRLIPAEKEWL